VKNLKHWKLILLLTLALFGIFIFYAIQRETPTPTLTVAFLNIGQGDAIYIESPTGNQIIVDGGPSSAILGELRKVMPFYDRTIDAIVVTNPDKDHYAGFIDVLDRFQVATVIEPGTKSTTDTYKTFSKDVDEEHARELLARRGMKIELGGGAVLEILYPDKDVSDAKTNDGSVIAKLMYGSTSVMLTGDAPSESEEYLLTLAGTSVDSDILKVGHHGSKTSTSEAFVKNVSPQYAVISAGCKNRYGHPTREVLDILAQANVQTFTTCEKGTIIFESDGKSFSLQ
jgi:competence protein ComEC